MFHALPLILCIMLDHIGKHFICCEIYVKIKADFVSEVLLFIEESELNYLLNVFVNVEIWPILLLETQESAK